MTPIPMSIDGLHEQYLHYCEEEKHRRNQAKEAKRLAKKAYQRWQRALAEREKGLR